MLRTLKIHLPIHEVLERHAVGEALATNSNTFQHTVASESSRRRKEQEGVEYCQKNAPQLVKHHRCVDLHSTLLFVGLDASNEVRASDKGNSC